MKTKNKLSNVCNKNKALRRSQLKEMYIVRYADDFKIFCRNYRVAKIIYGAVQKWLKERLQLEINPEKSNVTNLKKNYTEFLGFKIKAIKKKKKFVVKSAMTNKAIKNCVNKLKSCIKEIKDNPTSMAINKYNSTVLGLQNYYVIATNISINFKNIAYLIRKTLYNQLRKNISKSGIKSNVFVELYGKSNMKTRYISRIAIFPIEVISTKPPMCFKQEICDYTQIGRELIHRNLQRYNMKVIRYLMNNPVQGESIEYNDNRISLYIAQYGKCAITQKLLEIGDMEAHHIIPKQLGGKDNYQNLLYVTSNVHKLIHSINLETIEKYLETVKPNKQTLDKINEYRVKAGNCLI